MRYLASILLGLACGTAFLLLVGASVLSGVFAFLSAWVLAAIFNEALTSHNENRPRCARGRVLQDRRGGDDARAER